jgi:acyl carrier protein phosphodiesterase
MNYLAHAYLNGTRGNDVLMGNMMGDFIKGNQFLSYEPAIQQGILLHRSIDTFTDTHTIVSQAKNYFRAEYGLYSGALVDVMWDHFLANDITVFDSDVAVQQFTQNVYAVLQQHSSLMTERMAYMCKYMIQYDWLYNYKKVEGIFSSWRGMSKRLEHLKDTALAEVIFTDNYKAFAQMFLALKQDLQKEFLTQ